MASSSSSSSNIHEWIYDVFITFRGEDTRDNFVSHLATALSNAGIKVFRDDEELTRGEFLAPSLFRAIEVSRISLVVLSSNYVKSRWCLKELVKIMECQKTHGQLVIPIFYKVDPSDVRHQRGTFALDLEATEEDVLLRRKAALTQVGNLSGFHLSNFRSEAEAVEKIVDQVLKKTDHTLPITKAIYNQIHRKFEQTSFIENIRENNKRGHIHLQEQLPSDVLKTQVKIQNAAFGTTMIDKRLSGRRALVVLDDHV